MGITECNAAGIGLDVIYGHIIVGIIACSVFVYIGIRMVLYGVSRHGGGMNFFTGERITRSWFYIIGGSLLIIISGGSIAIMLWYGSDLSELIRVLRD